MTHASTAPWSDGHPLYAFLGVAPTAVLVVDSRGVIAYANQMAVQIFGYSIDELVGRPVEMLLPPERAAEHVRQRESFMQQRSSKVFGMGRHDFRARHKDGTAVMLETSLVPLERNGQRLVVVSASDVTQRIRAEAALQEISRCYLTLCQMNQAIARAADTPSLFAETCRVAVEQGGYLGAWVAQRGEGYDVVGAASAGPLDDFVGQLGVNTDPDDPHGRGPTGLALREGHSYYGHQFDIDEATMPWRELAASFGIHATASLPIRQGGEVVAALTLFSGSADAFTAEVRSLLEALADNLSFALDRFDAQTRLYAVARERTQLSQRLVAAQEAERARIAADVHDDSVQSLAALDLRLGLLRRQLSESGHEAAASVDELHRTVVLVATDLRDLLFELEPAPESQQLAEMLQEAAEHIFSESDCRWSMHVDLSAWDKQSTLSPTDRGQALRIVKEALFNVRRHSRATRVVVHVTPLAEGVEVAVEDDGVGFVVSLGASAPGHRGLANMLDRASVSGGWCRIESGDGGTTVRTWFPYDEAAAAWAGPTELPDDAALDDLLTPQTEVPTGWPPHTGLGSGS